MDFTCHDTTHFHLKLLFFYILGSERLRGRKGPGAVEDLSQGFPSTTLGGVHNLRWKLFGFDHQPPPLTYSAL